MISFDARCLYECSDKWRCLLPRKKITRISLYNLCHRRINISYAHMSVSSYFSISKQLVKQSKVFPFSPILSDIYMHYFANTLIKKISFPFWTRYVDDTFILIDSSLHKVNCILDINSSTVIFNLLMKLKTMVYILFLIH